MHKLVIQRNPKFIQKLNKPTSVFWHASNWYKSAKNGALTLFLIFILFIFYILFPNFFSLRVDFVDISYLKPAEIKVEVLHCRSGISGLFGSVKSVTSLSTSPMLLAISK